MVEYQAFLFSSKFEGRVVMCGGGGHGVRELLRIEGAGVVDVHKIGPAGAFSRSTEAVRSRIRRRLPVPFEGER